ncbi:transmembrane protein 135-like [Sitophilus oryzae]|uniref:Transmembrane protein 135-like n=1 Tax=Sitophilus oryzae TaxID=7048 RepID=A0A6J2XY41_SITOR|nr:transmembrane protein 135-like [Sitophilus oryzae]
MVVLSKELFYEKVLKEFTCNHLHTWEGNCLKANFDLCCDVFLGSLKFFIPIYVIRAVLDYRKYKDKKVVLKKFVQNEIRSSFYGMLLGSLLLGSNCVLCRLTGRMNYYNIGLISGLVSGLGLLVETKENKILDTLIFFNLLVESAFQNIDYHQIVNLTVTKQTIFYMLISSALMYMIQKKNHKLDFVHFWFYTPKNFMNLCDENYTCYHKNDCYDYIFKKSLKYFGLGYAFSIIKKLIPKMLSLVQKPQNIFGILVNKDNVRFGAFIGGYVCLYRFIICHLLKAKIIDKKYFGAIAGFLAGGTYAVAPNIQVLVVGITTLLQVFYHQISQECQIKNSAVLQQLVYMVSHAILIHLAFVSVDTCPKYYINMINTATRNLYKKLYNNLVIEMILS